MKRAEVKTIEGQTIRIAYTPEHPLFQYWIDGDSCNDLPRKVGDVWEFTVSRHHPRGHYDEVVRISDSELQRLQDAPDLPEEGR